MPCANLVYSDPQGGALSPADVDKTMEYGGDVDVVFPPPPPAASVLENALGSLKSGIQECIDDVTAVTKDHRNSYRPCNNTDHHRFVHDYTFMGDIG